MTPKKKTVSSKKRIGRVLDKKSALGKSVSLKGDLLKDKKDIHKLKAKVREQTDELKIRGGQLRQGANREKIAEEQLHVQAKAMEAASDGIFVIDAQAAHYPVVYANIAFQKIVGYSKHEVIGQDYFLLYGADADLRVIGEIKKTMTNGKSFRGEMLNFSKTGKKFWSYLRFAPVRNSLGTITHYVGIQTDITLIKQRDLEIEEQREEILHVTRVGKLAEFVSSLAHEISQPLTAILSYAQAAQRMYAGREPQLQEILQYIINDDQRAAEVIRRLRVLLKKNKPTFDFLDINALINDTVSLIMTHITVRNKTLKFSLADNLPPIKGDKIQLQQVLLNLVSNGLEAMDLRKDSKELLITTSLFSPGMAMVTVKDSGCGIPEKNKAKLFSHFFTNKPDGLGMGLSISRSIVEAHGGRLSGENNSDYGANFYFTIPIYPSGEIV